MYILEQKQKFLKLILSLLFLYKIFFTFVEFSNNNTLLVEVCTKISLDKADFLIMNYNQMRKYVVHRTEGVFNIVNIIYNKVYDVS